MNTKYLNPYFAGFLLGLVLLATIFVSGRGLGASGAVKGVVAGTMWAVAPAHAASGPFYEAARTEGKSPFKDWLVFEVAGVLLGAFLSGVISDRLKLSLERGPRATNRRRLVAALAGGALFGIGGQLGRGCTSGAALSGMAVLSAAGFITMLAIFGSAYGVAYFFRRLWI
ncbi:MAG: YeeE/YedE thiosulfate transporter family protein [Bryobacteraceae bacterium]